jgi:O-antigen ligase
MELLLLLIGIIGMIWMMVYARRGTLIVSFALLLIIASCFGHAFFHHSVGPLPITIDRLLWCGLVLQFLYHFRWKSAADQEHAQTEPKSMSRLDWFFLLYIAYIGCNVFMSDWQSNGKMPLANWLFYYIMPAITYALGRQLKLGERKFRWFTGIMVCFGIYLALTGFAETRQWWFAVFPRYIGDVTKIEFLGRARGPFMNPVSCGIFQVFSLCCLLMWWPRVSTRGKTIILMLSGALCLGIVCTLTRSVWMTLPLCAGGIIWLASTNRTRGLVLAGSVLLGVIALGITGGELNHFKRDQHVTEAQMSESAALRPMLAAVAVEMSQEKPIFGYGLAQYKLNSAPYHFTDKYGLPLRRVSVYIQHNVFLAALVETGLIGLTMLAVLLMGWSRMSWRLWRNGYAPLWARQMGLLQVALILAFAVNGMFHDTLVIPMGTSLLFSLAGLTSGVAYRFRTHAVALPTCFNAQPQSAKGPVLVA